MAMSAPSVDSLLEQGKKSFLETFHRPATKAAVSPGRVNLIGEHTDYNYGFVFPVTIPLYTVVVGSANGEGQWRFKSLSPPEDGEELVTVDIYAEMPLEEEGSKWANYILGVIAHFHRNIPGFDAVIVSSVPLGGGLSSSAALEVATYTFLEALTGTRAKSGKDKAIACQEAECTFAGVPCGIMDQFISTMGVRDSALLIDCRSLEATVVPLDDPDITVLVVNSNVKHQLSGSEYPTRGKQCYAAAKAMGAKSLRDVTLDTLSSHKSSLDDTVFKRARHVVGEIKRTEDAQKYLAARNYQEFGRLMNESHLSLRDDYEVSCPEIDLLVEIAQQQEGVFGSRLTGGGFGGCTVTLVKREKVEELIKKIKDQYSGKPTFYICHPVDGARILLE